jgi:hypothetical protein
MSIELELKRANGGFAWLAILLCLLVGAMGAMKRVRGYRSPDATCILTHLSRKRRFGAWSNASDGSFL